MRNTFLSITVLIVLVSLQSCIKYNCKNPDSEHIYYGIDASASDSSSRGSSGFLIIKPLSKWESLNNKENCQTEIFSIKNQIITNTVKVFCNREIRLSNMTIPANQELLRGQYKDYISINGLNDKIETFEGCTLGFKGNANADNGVVPGTYTFYVEASSKNGNVYHDTVATYIYKPAPL